MPPRGRAAARASTGASAALVNVAVAAPEPQPSAEQQQRLQQQQYQLQQQQQQQQQQAQQAPPQEQQHGPPQEQQLGIPQQQAIHFQGPPCGPPPPPWVFSSIAAATEAVKAHALANGYNLVLKSRYPSNDNATAYSFRCGKGGHRRKAPTQTHESKRRRTTTQMTDCPFTTTIKRDKYAPAPGQVWRIQPHKHAHNHGSAVPLAFRSQRTKLLEAHRDSILMMHNDGIRVSKIRQYLKLEELSKKDLYNIIQKYTRTARANLMEAQRQQQAELQQIAGQLGQMLPMNMGGVGSIGAAGGEAVASSPLGGVEDLSDMGQLRQLMAADGGDSGEDDEEDDEDEDMDDDDVGGEEDRE